VHLVTHEGQFWKWRLQGGFVTLAEELRKAIADHGKPDLVLATSLLDLAGLLGLARRELAGVPALLYMHENQVTYPVVGRARRDPAHALANWAAVLAADGVAFNSEFHLDTFFGALPELLGWFPDRRHLHLLDGVREKSVVLPVGVDLQRLDGIEVERAEPPLILWNHRWDPDKAPEVFLDVLLALAEEGVPFRVALAGERFVKQDEEHLAATAALGDRVVVAAHLGEAEYLATLRSADIVVSTALQEFFGVSVVEAMYAGAVPVLPDRLVYPERVPEGLSERSLYRTPAQLAELLRALLADPPSATERALVREHAAAFDWSVVAPTYDSWLERTTGG
jgi:glycosyltransferase involved in cell wall biosynthesis